MPELDRKSTSVFAGKVVRKDLVRKVKVGETCPSSYWNTCWGNTVRPTTPWPSTQGCAVVNTTLSSNFVGADEANKAQSLVKDKGKHTLIDKVKSPLHCR